MNRAYYLRKKYWLNDFIHGAQMWKQYLDVIKTSNNQYITSYIGEGKRNIYVQNIINYAKRMFHSI